MSTASDAGQRYAIGLDVGGTKIAGGIVALDAGRVLTRRETPTLPARGGQAVLDTALALAQNLFAEAGGREIAGIGVGVCELVDLAGNVTSGYNVAWQGLPVRERFAQLAPSEIESDVRAAALAEARYGAGQAFDPFAYVTVGTGISACLIQAGRPFAGARGNALVLTTGPLTTICAQCGASTRTVIEEIASGPALVARYNARTGRSVRRGEDVMTASKAGDPIAAEVVRAAAESLGMAVGWLANVLDPEAIVVGGGLGLAGDPYWSAFVAACRQHIWADTTRKLPIIPAQLGVDAGLIGAAAATDRSQNTTDHRADKCNS